MQALRQMGGGIVFGLLSLIIVLGGLALGLAEGYVPQPPPTPSATPLWPPTFTAIPNGTFFPTPSETLTASPIPPTNCPPPSGWILVIVNPGDTLELIAARYHTTTDALRAANCLVSDSVLPGYGLYVPPLPTNTFIPCGAPFGWVQYTVQPGDTLYHISQLYRVTVSQLQQANCLGGSTSIYPGQKLWVPNVATSTPPATPINIEFATVTPTPSDTPSATNTASPTVTESPTAIPPNPTPSQTPTPTPTDTPIPPTP